MKLTKFISFAVALIMLVSLFAACAKPENPDGKDSEGSKSDTVAIPDTPSSGSTAESTQSPSSSETLVSDDIDDSVNFGGQKISILYWKDVERPEFDVENEKNADIVLDALYARNTYVKERLGVEFDWVPQDGNFGNQAEFVKRAENDVHNDKDYDIFAGYSLTGATLTLHGCSSNLLDPSLKYLNFNKPWWPQSLIGSAQIKNKLYFCSGDISTNLLHMMYAIIYNKDMFKNYNPNVDIYSLVENKEWTFDKMFELCENVYVDENGNGSKDYGDTFGFMTIDLHFDAFYSGAGLKTIEKDSNGSLIVSPDFSSERAQSMSENLVNFLFNSGFAFAEGTNAKYSGAVAMRDGNAMFVVDRVYITSGTLKEVSDFDIGVLPVPMYDKTQENYVTCMAFPYTLYSISSGSKNKVAAAATLECMGSEGYRNVTPALFETSMKLRYVDAEEDADMFDTIRECVSIDVGRIFCTSYNNLTYSAFRNAIKAKNGNWKVAARPANSQMTKLSKTINDELAKLAG